MARLNLALIGAGRRGQGAHLPVIAKLGEVYNFVAVCDVSEAVAKEVAQKYGVKAYTSVREMVSKESLDVVDVTVPGEAHHVVCCFLARAGIHVLCETPIANTLPMSDVMIEAAQKHGVKLEVAENYYRAPRERLRLKVIAEGVIGRVSRIYRIFYEGGYHGMSMLRLLAGGQPKSILGITARSEVIPITDRMKRRHTSENWSLGYLDFDNGASALMTYSNVIHARSLGRGQGGVSQVDGSAGTLVGEEVHVVHPEDLDSGARSTAYTPERVVESRDGVEVLIRLDLKLRDKTISWENPFAKYGVTEGQVAVADELLSIAGAVKENREPDYGAVAGRLDQEMNIAMSESGLKSRETISFPLKGTTEMENRTHARFEQEFGHKWNEVDKLLDTFFPRR